MESLYDILQKELSSLKIPGFETLDFFNNNKNGAVQFISKLENTFWDDEEIKEKVYNSAQNRAYHSIVTYLLGRALMNFGNVNDLVGDDFEKLWLLISINHDRAYYSEYLRSDIDYVNAFGVDNLLSIRYTKTELLFLENKDILHNILAFNYDEILAYDVYARKYHKIEKHENEKVDHGILGGMLLFDYGKGSFLKYRIKNEDIMRIKQSALTIAQHNIYKSESAEKDSEYPEILLEKLSYASKFRVNRNTPLLFLLGLVDTIECLKRFGKKDNNLKYFQNRSVLKKIKMEIGANSIRIDYNDLRDAIKKEKKDDVELVEILNNYIKSVTGLSSWLSCNTTEANLIVDINLQIAEEKEP